jgi:hypothetical protein
MVQRHLSEQQSGGARSTTLCVLPVHRPGWWVNSPRGPELDGLAFEARTVEAVGVGRGSFLKC